MSIVMMIAALEGISHGQVTFNKYNWRSDWTYSVQGEHSGNNVSFSGNAETFELAVYNAYTTMNKLIGAVPAAFGMLPPPTEAEIQHLDEEVTKEDVTEADDWLKEDNNDT